MKMTLREVIKNHAGLARLGNKTFPSKLSFAVSCNLERLQKEAERVEKERKKLCEQFADKDEKGDAVMVDSVVNGQKTKEYKMSEESRKLFSAEYEALLDEETEISIRTVKTEVIEQCESADRYSIPTVGDIVTLAFMTEE